MLMLVVFVCLYTGGKGDREMIPMNDLGPGKCESRNYIHIHTTGQYHTGLI